ncbi:MAG: TonB-dependent receptor [Bacteroidales bacterium]|nr:TonB-dependent receptor [Bacteroidales bacterium]
MKNGKVSSSICFRRWTRKNFAAFANLGKVVKIGVLVAGFSMINSTIAKGENTLVKDSLSSDRELELKEVTVTGSKVESLQGLTTTQQVISKRDIERLPIVGLESALKQSTGIDIRERGTRGVQADLSIRGGSFDQSLIFLNGVNFTDSRTGHQNLSLPIDIEIVDKINLLHGLTTPGAITGAINLITATSEKSYLNAEVSAGQFGYQLYRLNGNYHFESTNLFAAVSQKKSDGYVANTDFETTNAFIHIRHTCPRLGQFDLQTGYQVKAFGANAFYTLAYPNQYERTRTAIASLGWNKILDKIVLTSNVNYKRVYDKFQMKDINKTFYHRTDDYGASFLTTYYSSIGKTFLGADYKLSHIYSNNIGDSIASRISVPGETNAFYYLEKQRETANIFIKQRVNVSDLQVEGDINYAITSFGDDILWGLNASYELLSWLNVTANANHNIRIPTFTDLYYKSATQISDPNLKLENSTSFDLGLDTKIGNIDASASVFSRRINEMIDWVKYTPTDKWRAINYAEMNTTGIEASVSISFEKYIKTIALNYTHLNSDNPAGTWISKYALCYLRDKLVASTQIAITDKLMLGIVGTYWNRNDSFSEVSGSQYNYLSYFTLDSKITWSEKHYTLKIEGSNLTNTKYFDFGGLIQPGTWINGGIIFKL